ncbi:MAG: TRAP transporter small permease [Clostridiales Family XIII bacterium]|jgi:TRAP-type C4-dicarboxylate transport system permease small subunit|nr:TRAP transporter small permease [Clostridiales Family XIII bacterium]
MNKLLLYANKIWRFEAAAAWVFLFANVLLIVVNIVMRRFFNAPIVGATEIIRYISLVAAGLSLAQNEWIDGNITMSLIHEKLKVKSANRLRAVTNSIVSLIFILITYLLYIQVSDKIVNLDVSYELQIPVWIPALVLAFGFTLLTVSIIIKSVLLWFIEATGAPAINFRDLVVPRENQSMES